MAEDNEQSSYAAHGQSGAKDIRFDYLRDRTVSTLRVGDGAWEKLMSGDSRYVG